MKKIVTKSAGRKASIWTKENKVRLSRLYPTTANVKIAEIMGVSVSAVCNQAAIMKLKKTSRFWTAKQEKFLVDNWSVLTAAEIAAAIGKSKWAVTSKAQSLKQKQDS